jgi:hypothetical protein
MLRFSIGASVREGLGLALGLGLGAKERWGTEALVRARLGFKASIGASVRLRLRLRLRLSKRTLGSRMHW